MNTISAQATQYSLQATAVELFSQQLWCFGEDVKHPAGNLLIEAGCDRNPAPEDKLNCPSIYTLHLSQTQRITLRGFGIFIGDDEYGGLFIERFQFEPAYTKTAALQVPPWEPEDLPQLQQVTQENHSGGLTLLSRLIEWFVCYEQMIVANYGEDYRNQTLFAWDNGTRWCVSSCEMLQLWNELAQAIKIGRWNPMVGEHLES